MSGAAVVAEAKKHLGVKYKLLGRDPNGFDEIYFIIYCYKKVCGITLKNTISELLNSGAKVSRDKLKLGDIVITKEPRPGIYIGNNQLIRTRPGRKVEITSIPSFMDARRIINK